MRRYAEPQKAAPSPWPKKRPISGRLTMFEESIIATHAAAILAIASERYGTGKPFHVAIEEARSRITLSAMPPWCADMVNDLVDGFTAADCHHADRTAHFDLVFDGMVRDGYVRDTWFQRRLWRWFGLTL